MLPLEHNEDVFSTFRHFLLQLESEICVCSHVLQHVVAGTIQWWSPMKGSPTPGALTHRRVAGSLRTIRDIRNL